MQKETKGTDPREQVAEMLHDLYERRELTRGVLLGLSRELHRQARTEGVRYDRPKAETYLALKAASKHPGAVEYLETEIRETWESTKDAPDPRDKTTARLRAFYEYAVSNYVGGRGKSISQRLFRLADKAGIHDARRTTYKERHTVYTRAAEAGFAESFEAEMLRSALDDVEAGIMAEGKAKATPKSPAATRRTATYYVSIHSDEAAIIGYIKG